MQVTFPIPPSLAALIGTEGQGRLLCTAYLQQRVLGISNHRKTCTFGPVGPRFVSCPNRIHTANMPFTTRAVAHFIQVVQQQKHKQKQAGQSFLRMNTRTVTWLRKHRSTAPLLLFPMSPSTDTYTHAARASKAYLTPSRCISLITTKLSPRVPDIA